MSRKELIRKYVYKQIIYISSLREHSIGRALLAKLRRGAGKYPGELPELWGIFLNDLPEELLSRDGKPSNAEWSIYLSLTMYALHQQGNSNSVHAEKISLGSAAAQLMDEKADKEVGYERVMRRFAPVITAKDMPEFSHYLRCLVNLFSSKDIKLDYVKLAEDIYDFQFEGSRKRIQLSWGQDFYRNKGEEKQ